MASEDCNPKNHAFPITTVAAVGWTLLIATLTQATEPVDFGRDVQPILQQKCWRCHGPENEKSGLRLDRRVSMLRGGDYDRPSIVPGKPEASFLIDVVASEDAEPAMPPEGDRLTEDEIATLRDWIRQGAPWPGQMHEVVDLAATEHWSFQPLKTFPDASIDSLLEQKLHSVGLGFSPPADPATLLRRTSLVLTGLPPTPDELTDLLSHDPDVMDAAFDRAVERMLDSPRYGERWAQHWLDVIRWAETVGFETNLERPRAWPYRDWLIRSLNDDKPYDEFIFEQIAGDTIGQDAALGFLTAGPANLPGQIGRDEEAMRQARQDELDEVIRTVSQAFMGLTVGCARCHNHKFDPIRQRDYYSMQAIFAGMTYGERRLRGEENDEWTAKVPAAQAKLDQLVAELEAMRVEFGLEPPVEDLQTHHFDPILAKSVRMEIRGTANSAPASLYELEIYTVASDSNEAKNVALASAGATPSASSFALANQTRHFDNLVDGDRDRRQAFPWVSASGGPAWVQVDLAEPKQIDRIRWDRGSSVPADYQIQVLPPDASEWIVVADTSRRLPREDDTRNSTQVTITKLSAEEISRVVEKVAQVRAARNELARLSAGPQVFAARFNSPSETWLLHRGDPMQRREQVPPAVPIVLGDLGLAIDAPEIDRRVALAKHLTSADHPLTARVIVNRVWQHHFGHGLVDTPSDFGEMGSEPKHPELLDHLAAAFIADGWSLKNLHRRIIASRAFRQSSHPRGDALQIDADSRLMWRFPPRRLEAEAIRDSILHVSGKLNLKMGGSGFNLFRQRGGLSGYTPIETFEPEGWRRMIYAHKIRMQKVDVFGDFDCPDAGQMKPKRTRSITPTQTLGLFNSPMIMRQAEFFADRVKTGAPESIPEQIELAFRIALSRSPDQHELTELTKFAEAEGMTQLCRVLLNTSEFLTIQ